VFCPGDLAPTLFDIMIAFEPTNPTTRAKQACLFAVHDTENRVF
jgi:hypothetical protein